MKEIVNQPKELKGYRVVQDGDDIMKALMDGETVMHWESGYSMYPLLSHLEYCKISPYESQGHPERVIGKPVFCKFLYRGEDGEIHDAYMVHRCTEIHERDGEVYYRIDSTNGQCYGWTKDVYGVAESTNIFQDESVLWS